MGRRPKTYVGDKLPSRKYIIEYEAYLEYLELEKFEREDTFLKIKTEIQALAVQLKLKPTLDFERNIISQDDGQFLVTDQNMESLKRFHNSVLLQRDEVTSKITELREQLDSLWGILEEDRQTCEAFLQTNTGYNYETLAALTKEVQRCENLKKANIEVCKSCI